MHSYYRNMVLIDGKGAGGCEPEGRQGPVPGKLIEVIDSPEATTMSADLTDCYNWMKRDKAFELDHGMYKEAFNHTSWNYENPFIMNRKMELPFHEQMKTFSEGFGHLDYGAWHGENRGTERYQQYNDVEYVFRTMHLARGKQPYLLIVDDLKKDELNHTYDWNLNLQGDALLWKTTGTPLFRSTSGISGTDLHLCIEETAHNRTVKNILNTHVNFVTPTPKKGDPMLLVRVLWKNADYNYPLPTFERVNGFSRINIPANCTEAAFKILIFPYRFGDFLPVTHWTDDKRILTVEIEEQKDEYTFEKGEKGQTILAMKRDGREIQNTSVKPASPELLTPSSLFTDSLTLAFKTPAGGSGIHYTLDGTMPTRNSPLYSGPVTLKKSARVRAITYTYAWPGGEELAVSEDCVAEFNRVDFLKPASPATYGQGLLTEVFEIKTSIFDEKRILYRQAQYAPCTY
ncbi:MAG: chitobiase/beta-hexosaminidase C-terminal domain-containing protein [Bacteroides sp.]|nr:chitobiase/beta-hexosaminidase C-terminal domain-containing protein [Bacteroides sp.]